MISAASVPSSAVSSLFGAIRAVFWILAAADVLLFISVAIVKPFRPSGGALIRFSSYIFGFITFVVAAWIALAFLPAVVVGIAFVILIVPMYILALVAAATHGLWNWFAFLLVALAITFTTRLGGRAIQNGANVHKSAFE